MPDQPLKAELRPSFVFSQSSLQDFADCPRRFQLRYIEQLQWPAVESEPISENERRQKEGQLFHRLVQQHLAGLPAEKLSPPPGSADLQRWWENYLADPVAQNPGIPGKTACNVELVLSAPVGNFRLMAKYDLLLINVGEKAVIYDWKTSRKRPRDEWMAARLQTRVYPALVVRAGASLNGGIPFQPEQVEMIYWYADHPTEPVRFPYNAARYQVDWEAITGMVNEVANHRFFPANENDKQCAYCTYRSYCNRGEEAGSLDEQEAGMEAAMEELNANFDQIPEIEF
jgi:CRISPR/Cas system-associated exonuclease Cas4 (RecB family)